MVQIIPDVGGWTQPIVARNTLNRTQSRITQTQISVCAEAQPLRWGYGRNRVGAMWLKPIVYARSLYLPFITCRGPIDAVELVDLGNAAPPAGVSVVTYLGTTGQAIDPWLQAAWSNAGHVYADTLDGIAWGCLRIDSTTTSIPTDVAITARMALLYDPRQDSTAGGSGPQRLADPATWAYSANPVLALADFLRSPDYGRGENVDWASVAAVADIADETVGTGKRRGPFGLVIDSVQAVAAIEDTLRTYAACWVVREGGVARLIADAPSPSVFVFSNAAPPILTQDGDPLLQQSGQALTLQEGSANYLADSIKISQRRRADAPTVVSVVWTDTSVSPWAVRTHTEMAAGVSVGAKPWREESVQLPGIQDAGWAKREAIRRLNVYITSDLTVNLTATGEAIELRRGDVVTLIDSEGLDQGKKFRLTDHVPAGPGLWDETLMEYDAAAYSDAVADGPGTPDTTYPLPSAPPALASVTAVEQTYALQTGAIASRLLISWAEPDWPFVRAYQIVVRDGTTVAASATVGLGLTAWTTPALQEGITYTITAAIISTVDAVGAAASTLCLVAGKALPPGNVMSLTGREVGGRVLLAWTRADNPTNPGTPDPDVAKYEVRRDTTSASWGDATNTIVNVLDALRTVDEGVPAGTWRYFVKAIDSIGQYSASAATADVVVTSDTGAFLVSEQQHSTYYHLDYCWQFTLGRVDPRAYYVTEDLVAFGTKFGSTLDTYTDILATYHDPVTSSWKGNLLDFGLTISGQWTGTADVTALSGSVQSQIGHSTNFHEYSITYEVGMSTQLTARYVRLRHITLTTSTMLVRMPTQSLRLEAIPREESGTGTSSASGATTITLVNPYAACVRLMITPEANVPRIAVYDNIVIGATTTFDVYIFDVAGDLQATPFRYHWQGV